MSRTLRVLFVASIPLLTFPVSAQLRNTPLLDGTGTVGLPAGWTIQGSAHGQVAANNASNDTINFGMPWTILDPRSSVATLRTPYPVAMAQPGDLIAGLRSVLAVNAKARLLSTRVKRMQGVNGAPAAMIMYEFNSEGHTYAAIGYFAALVYPGSPSWSLYCSAVVARKERFAQQLPTLMAVWKSWRPNGQKPTEGSATAIMDEVITHRKASFEEIQKKFREGL